MEHHRGVKWTGTIGIDNDKSWCFPCGFPLQTLRGISMDFIDYRLKWYLGCRDQLWVGCSWPIFGDCSQVGGVQFSHKLENASKARSDWARHPYDPSTRSNTVPIKNNRFRFKISSDRNLKLRDFVHRTCVGSNGKGKYMWLLTGYSGMFSHCVKYKKIVISQNDRFIT